MRIISGIYKNRRINFKKLPVRPTTDFAKESLFNILNNHFDLKTVSVLDLFAGTGNISYEFLSREVKNVIAIENNIKCVNFMRKMKKLLNLETFNIKLLTVNKYLTIAEKKQDIIFADPPYNYTQSQYNKLIDYVFKKKLLNKKGLFIIEHSSFINFKNHSFCELEKKYGRVHFTFLKHD